MKSNIACNSCNSLTQDNLTLFQTEFWKIDLAMNQAYLGRSYVNLKRHVGQLSLLTLAEWAELGEVIRRFEEMTSTAFGATCFNWTALMNNTYKNDASSPHVHLHVWPRYQTPPVIEGVSFADPNFAHHYDKTATRDFEPKVLSAIQSKLTKETQPAK